MILADKLKGAGGVGALQASYVDGYARDDTAGFTTPHSFTSSFGDAASNRYILVSIADYPESYTVTGVTIGGVSATILSTYGGRTVRSTFAIAAVPSGTSGTVSISTSSATLLSAAVYRLVGLKSTTPTSTKTQDLTTLTTGSGGTVTASGTKGGYIFAAFSNGSSETEVHGAHGFGATATTGTDIYDINWTVSTGTALAGDVTQTRNDYLRTLSSNSAGGMHIIALR